MMKTKKGLVQVYTGNGKGKSTAAFGLAIRASGAGMKIYIAQFIKGKNYSELKELRRIKNITLEQYGRGCFICRTPKKEDIDRAIKGLKRVRHVMNLKKYDVVILDEINVALKFRLITKSDVESLIKEKPVSTELILTGRYFPRALLSKADLVTEMREIKHPYKIGQRARKGIEY